eukprot:TRINITY_DN665_c0_g1_i1.p1 TRINITY_DN665_c0_g1~~TRINITY_DN665_c0_g1_i1.p1  ORF type:complete len:138 (-),score=29.61 TRINITY_DN665_c0_g1_i1:473-886(-)
MASPMFCPQSPSPTAMKYMRYDPNGSSKHKFAPGELYRCHTDMESSVYGYRDLRREIRATTEELEWQSKYRSSPDRFLPPVCVLRNSILGYTSERVKGNNWRYDFFPSSIRFSVATPKNPYLTKTFRYMGMHRPLEV